MIAMTPHEQALEWVAQVLPTLPAKFGGIVDADDLRQQTYLLALEMAMGLTDFNPKLGSARAYLATQVYWCARRASRLSAINSCEIRELRGFSKGGESQRRMEWCPRSESNRHAFKGGGFSSHFDFHRPAGRSRAGSWAGARLHHSLGAVGARRLLSTPSPHHAGLGSA